MGLARDEDTALAASYDITPLVHSRESLEDPCAKPSDGTGEAADGCHQIRHRHVPGSAWMKRLMADYLRTLKEVRPVLVMSHLAASDTRHSTDFTHEQARRFHEATESMKAVFPGLKHP